jgi:MFS family permease
MNAISKPLINLSENKQLLILFFAAPLLNFFMGFTIEMYAPSVPSIISYFEISYFQGHRTLNAFSFGFCLGCLFLGPMMDLKGKRIVLLSAVFFYTLLCLAVLLVQRIQGLHLLRLSQGFFVSAFSIAARTFIFDNFSGIKYRVGINYTTFAYAVGVIIAPVLGSYLQERLGWQSIFIVYATFTSFLFTFFLLFVGEGKSTLTKMNFKEIIAQYLNVASDRNFLSASIIIGGLVFQLFSFSLLMPYFFSTKLHVNLKTFGFYAMLIGVFYLLGTMLNRLLLNSRTTASLCTIGFSIYGFSLFCYLLLAIFTPLTPLSILIPSFVTVFSLGLLIPNIVAVSLTFQPTHIGITAATQSTLYMFFCTFLNAAAIFYKFDTSRELVLYFIAIFMLSFTLYHKRIKPIMP